MILRSLLLHTNDITCIKYYATEPLVYIVKCHLKCKRPTL